MKNTIIYGMEENVIVTSQKLSAVF